MLSQAVDQKKILQEIQEIELRERGRSEKRKKYCAKIERDKEVNPWAYFQPYKWQKKCRDLIAAKTIIVNMFPNKIGKTAFWVCIIISWAMGYEAWNEVDPKYPGAIKVNDRYYMPSSLGIKPPVKIRITGEDWTSNLGQVVVPEMLKWAPVGQYTTKKNEAGIESIWNWKNGSIFQLMTHKQDPKLFESWIGHGWIPDEPPPRYIWEGMSRGLFLNKGKCLMSITPMSEAWILDELILSGRRDVGVMDGMTILANDDLKREEREIIKSICPDQAEFEEFWDTYTKLLIFTKKPDRGKKAEKFLYDNILPKNYDIVSKLKILRFVKDTPIDKFFVRIHGVSKALVGKVYHEYDEDIHICEAFDIPTDWPVAPMVDFHPDKPQAIGFYTRNKQDLKYVIDEHWEHLNAEGIADFIIRKKISNGWNIRDAWIDALSKGDKNYEKNEKGEVQSSFNIIEKKLKEHKIRLHVGAKKPKDGRRNVREWLKGPNEVPTVQFFDTLNEPPEYGHRYEISRWVYNDKGEPVDKDNHFMENFARFTLTGVKYKEPGEGKSYVQKRSGQGNKRGWMKS